jgi:hypothetical protein
MPGGPVDVAGPTGGGDAARADSEDTAGSRLRHLAGLDGADLLAAVTYEGDLIRADVTAALDERDRLREVAKQLHPYLAHDFSCALRRTAMTHDTTCTCGLFEVLGELFDLVPELVIGGDQR